MPVVSGTAVVGGGWVVAGAAVELVDVVDPGTVVEVVVVTTDVDVVEVLVVVDVVVEVVVTTVVDVDVVELLPVAGGWVLAGATVDVVGRPGLPELGMSMLVPSPNWRFALLPQQVTLPSLLNAHVCSSPAATDLTPEPMVSTAVGTLRGMA